MNWNRGRVLLSGYENGVPQARKKWGVENGLQWAGQTENFTREDYAEQNLSS